MAQQLPAMPAVPAAGQADSVAVADAVAARFLRAHGKYVLYW